MSLDVLFASHVAQGEPHVPAPLALLGIMLVLPAAPSTQVTGDDSTVLRAGYTGGRAKVYDVVTDFVGDSDALVHSTSGSQLLEVGEARYYTLVAVQHRVSGSINLLFIAGTIAAEAVVVVPTQEEIQTALGDNLHFAICGDARFHRSADTVIQTQLDGTRRAAYVDESKKTGVVVDTADKSNLGSSFHSYVDVPLDLAGAFGLGAAALYIDGAQLPSLPLGGFVDSWEYVPTVAGAGAGGDMTMRLGVDATVEASSDLQLLLAATALGSAPTSATLSPKLAFDSGDGLDVEVEAAATAFTAGSGVLRLAIHEYSAA